MNIMKKEPKQAKEPVKRNRPRKTYTLSPVTIENLRELNELLRDGESRIIDQAVAAFYKQQTGISDKDYIERLRALDQ